MFIRGRCLFEGGVYSRAAFIRGRRLFEGGVYSRAVFIRGRHLFYGDVYSQHIVRAIEWAWHAFRKSDQQLIFDIGHGCLFFSLLPPFVSFSAATSGDHPSASSIHALAFRRFQSDARPLCLRDVEHSL